MSLADLFKPVYGIAIKRSASPHEVIHKRTFDNREDAARYIRKIERYGTYTAFRVVKMEV